MEIWKDIKGYEGEYQVSSLGRVKSLKRNKIRILWINRRNGYAYVTLSKNNIIKNARVHRLVADAFLPEDLSRPFINHKDGRKANNRLDNLERCTASENLKHAYSIGLKDAPKSRKVYQFDLNGKLLAMWDSETEAAKAHNIHQPNIDKVCRGQRKTAGGYVWRFADER